MKVAPRNRKTTTKGRVIALALTWDGARWPVSALPQKARAFLRSKLPKTTVPAAKQIAELFTRNEVAECRICWVPQLKGGPEVLSEPFLPASGRRVSFVAAGQIAFGDVLGVVYRRK